MEHKTTTDGLAVVTEEIFEEFLRNYKLNSPNNDPEVTKRIESENPQIYRILKIGMENAPTKEARAYYECGMQIVYELLRMQTYSNKKDQ